MHLFWLIIAFLGTIAILTVFGNGILSFITAGKRNYILTPLETVMVSFGIGLSGLFIYFYITDFFGHSNFFLLILVPLFAGIVLKLASIPREIGVEYKGWGDYKTYIRQKWDNLTKWYKKKDGQKNVTQNERRFRIVVWIVLIFTIFILISEFTGVINLSTSLFSSDPYEWGSFAMAFRKDPFIDYSNLEAYPAGFTIFFGYLLFLDPETTFTAQYWAVKWFPLLNIVLIILFLYPIQKRLFNKKSTIFFLLTILLVFQKYFIYRTLVFVPTILLTVQLEVVILLCLIKNFPKPILYLCLGSMIFVHPANALYCWMFYFGFIIAQRILTWLKNIKNQPDKSAFFKNSQASAFSFLGDSTFYMNLICFLIPIGTYILSLTILYRIDWIDNYLSYFTFGTITTIIPAVMVILQTLFGINLQSVEYNFGWIQVWGDTFYIILIVGLFLNFKQLKLKPMQRKFINFAKFTVVVTLAIIFLPTFAGILEPLSGNPLVQTFLSFVNSSFYSNYDQRVLEVVDIINTIFLVFILEDFYYLVFQRERTQEPINDGNAKKLRNWQKKRIYYGVLIGIFIYLDIWGVSYVYYEYDVPSSYSEGLLFFREYLNANGTKSDVVAYCQDDANLDLVFHWFFRTDTTLVNFNCSITPSDLNTTILDNASSPINYVVIGVFDCYYWGDMNILFNNTNYAIFSNSQILILKIPK